jgi:hypothetical protein
VRIPALLVACLLVAGVAIARADAPHVDDPELVHAKELEAKLEYEEALTLVEKIIARGGADTQKLVELHFLAGKLAAGLDRVDVAQEHFARVLSLEPGTTLPDGTSPKITMPFDAARGQTAPLRILIQAGAIIVAADPLQLVSRTEIKDHEARAFDAYGNLLWHQRIEYLDTPPRDGLIYTPPYRPLYKRQVFWASGVLVFGTFAGFSAWRFKVAQDQWDTFKAEGTHDYSELLDIERRGHRWAAATYGGIGAAAVCALLTLLTAPRDNPHTMLFAAPDSVGVGVDGRF